MRATMLSVLALSAALAPTSSGAAELGVGLGGVTIPDPSFGLIDAGASGVDTFVLRVSQDVKPGLALSASWESGVASSSDYGVFQSALFEYDPSSAPLVEPNDYAYPETTVVTQLRVHNLSVGARIERSILRPWLFPYVSASARATLGLFSLEDSTTGWQYLDPEDPDQPEVIYEVEPYTDLGWSVGAEADLGVAVRLGGKARPSPSPTPAEAAANPGGGPAPADPAPAERSRLKWGAYMEAGYAAQTALRFQESGELAYGGLSGRMGVFVVF